MGENFQHTDGEYKFADVFTKTLPKKWFELLRNDFWYGKNNKL